jgi:prepilin-type N-terminal cleavage/methylation domain-containing protein
VKLFNQKKEEKGFTLIELLIVIGIIGILAGIAIPSFVGHRNRAFDSAAISDLKNAAIAQEAYYADHTTYSSNAVALQTPPYNLTFSTNVNVNITAADDMGYTMTSVHTSSGEVFTLTGPGGPITP